MVRALQSYRDDFHAALSAKTMTIAAAGLRELTLMRNDSTREELAEWLYPHDHSTIHMAKLQEAERGTGIWLFDEPLFRDWSARKEKLLVLQGKPGSGKSVVTSLLIDRLQETGAGPVVYFHFSHQESVRFDNVLRSLIKQVIMVGASLEEVQKLRSSRRQPLEKELLEILTRFGGFIVFDALDESPSFEAMLKVIRELASKGVSVCVSSRNLPALHKQVPISLEVVAQKVDLHLFLEMRFAELDLDMGDHLAIGFIETIVGQADGIFLIARLIMGGIFEASSIKEVRQLLSSSFDLATLYQATLDRILKSRRAKLARRALQWVSRCRRLLNIDELRHALAIEIGSRDMDIENLTPIDMILSSSMGLLILNNSNVTMVHPTAYEFFRTMPEDNDIGLSCLTYLQYQKLSQPCETMEELMSRLDQYQILDYIAKYWYVHLEEALAVSRILAFIRHDGHLASATQVFYFRAHQDSAARLYSFDSIPRGRTSIQAACAAGLLLTLDHLLELNSDAVATDSEGWSAMHLAASYGHAEVLKRLLEVEAVKKKTMNLKDKHGHTPLFWCSIKSHLAAVAVLVDAGADLSRRDKSGWTVLHWTAFKNDNEILQILLRSSKIGEVGRDALRSAVLSATHKNQAAFQTLMMFFDDETIRKKAADRNTLLQRHRRMEIASNMWRRARTLEVPVPVFLEQSNLLTPLFATNLFNEAVDIGHVDLVRLLLYGEWLKDYENHNQWRRGLLHAAALSNEPAIFYLLIQNGIEPNEDKDGLTPLHMACRAGSLELIDALLSVSKADEKALCYIWHNFKISENNHEAQVMVAERFIEAGATISSQTMGQAIFAGNLKGLELLLRNGGNLNQAILEDHTVYGRMNESTEPFKTYLLHLVAQGHHGCSANVMRIEGLDDSEEFKIEPLGLESLISLGASVDLQDSRGYTPLFVALECGNLRDANVLARHADPATFAIENDSVLHRLARYKESGCVHVKHGPYACVESTCGCVSVLKVFRTVMERAAPALIHKVARDSEPERRRTRSTMLPFDIAARTPRSGTPLLLAISNGRWELVQAFLERGAEMPLASDLLLDWTVDSGDYDGFCWLLERGAKVEGDLVYKTVSQMRYVDSGSVEFEQRKRMFLRCLELESDIVSTQPSRKAEVGLHRALHEALECDAWDEQASFDTIKSLIDKGADLAENNYEGKSALVLARWRDTPGLVEYIEAEMTKQGLDVPEKLPVDEGSNASRMSPYQSGLPFGLPDPTRRMIGSSRTGSSISFLSEDNSEDQDQEDKEQEGGTSNYPRISESLEMLLNQ
ncbi:ankyrin-1 [Colletotrichum spaethianum]|uniref:Ankyrin-1 n=1 Tax=Colletotrichum spaethianum TaxID=700344 RepID=A0AA37P4T3_9PEZI|nr:ankyrin-1 [Colletotrichum spaethianum]GKT41991.1 ankyrin-1 [Colletotrichum spaethianum]